MQIIYRLLNVAAVALSVAGHAVAGVFLTNRWLVGMEVPRYKQIMLAANLVAWPLLGLLGALPGGWSRFLGSVLRPFSAGRLWRLGFVALGARYMSQELYRRRHPLPRLAEVVSTRIEDADLTGAVFAAEHPNNVFMRLAELGVNQLFKLQTVTHVIKLDCLPPAFDGFTIVQITDIHYGSFTSAEFVRRAVQIAIEMEPALIVLTGDYQTYGRDVEAAAGLLAPLGEWSRRGGGGDGEGDVPRTLAVLGNHDRFDESAAHVTDALRRAGIRVLDNRHGELRRGESSLYIVGVADPWSHRDNMDLAMLGIPPEGCSILLAHVPDYLLTASRYPVALQLSGHNHGGQIKLPLLGHVVVASRYNRRYAEGFHKMNRTIMYASNGMGGHPPIRWGARPEIARIVLQAN